MLQNDKINCNGSFRDITMYFVKDPCVNVSILWIIIMYHVKPSCCSTSKIHWDMSNFLVHLKASWNTAARQCLKAKQEDGNGTAALPPRANRDPPPPTETSEMPLRRPPVTQPAPSLQRAVTTALPCWDTSRGTARFHPSIPLPAGELGAGDREGPPETATRHEPQQRRGGHGWERGEEPWALRTPVCREVVSAAPNEAPLWGSEKLPPPSARCVVTAGDETLASVPGAALRPAGF